jgi:hypothetical protein
MNISNRYLGRYLPVTNIILGQDVKILEIPQGYGGPLILGNIYRVVDIEKCEGLSDCATTCNTNHICIWVACEEDPRVHTCEMILGDITGAIYKGLMYPWQT